VADDLPGALQPKQLQQRADRLLREEPDLREHPAGRQAILDELVKRRKVLAAEVNREAVAVEVAVRTARRRIIEWWGVILLALAALAVLILLAFNQRDVPSLRDWQALWYYVFLVGLWVPFNAALLLQYLAVSGWRTSVKTAEGRLDQRLDIETPALIRQIMHEWDSDQRIWSSQFHSEVAPAMVELDMADTVSSATLKKLKQFIGTHHTSAIGIAGTRGSGKTTLMEQLRYDPELHSLSVRIPAPVYYNAHELLRLIHARLARAALGERERDQLGIRMAPSITRLLRPLGKAAAVIAIAAILISLWVIEQEDLEWSSKDAGFRVGALSMLAICGLSVVGGLLASKAWKALRRRSELLAEPSTVRALAMRQLDFLHWSIETQQTAKVGLDLEKFTAERESQLSRRERDVTHAESVDLLRDFLHDLARLSSRRLILVCIDELDKISNPKHSVNMINGIKDLFHIPGVHFVVSVSTDAMHRFAARGVPLRDVFDSSFDVIMSMRRLSLRESRLLVSVAPLTFVCQRSCSVMRGPVGTRAISYELLDHASRSARSATPISRLTSSLRQYCVMTSERWSMRQ
jgi:KAP family P-loop domain